MFYTALILLFAGLCVMAVELFVPSAGLLGVVAGCLIVAAVVMGFMTDTFSGMVMLLLALLSVPAMLFMMINVWPYTPIGRRLLTDDETLTDVLPRGEYYHRDDLAGKVGVAKSKMLPSGQVVIDGEKYDAVSDGFAIEAGDRIKVVEVKQNRIYVQPFDGEEPTLEAGQSVAADDVFNQPIEEFGLESGSMDDLLDG